MGTVNSLKGILLFAIRNGYAEVHLSKGKLPLLFSAQGERACVNGISPIGEQIISQIKRDYLSESTSIILSISEQDFLAISNNEDLIFRHIPTVSYDNNIDTRLASRLYSKKGLIVFSDEDRRTRYLKLYKALSYLANNKTTCIAIVEKNKYFGIKISISKIYNLYRPGTDLRTLIRIADTLHYNCMAIPDFDDEDTITTIKDIATEKLVITSCTPELAIKIDPEGFKKQEPKSFIRINKELMKENLIGDKHA